MLSEHLTHKADVRVRRLARSMIWSLLALFAGVAALGFLGAALWLWILGRLGPIMASGLVGLAFLAVALFGILMASLSKTRLPEPRPNVGVDDLAQAFFAAVEVGRSARRRK